MGEKKVKGTRIIAPGEGAFIYPTEAPDEVWPGDARMDHEWFAIPVPGVPHMVKEYLKVLDTAKTIDWCACRWEIHPDDSDLPENVDECKRCAGKEEEHPVTYPGDYRHPGSLELVERELICKKYEQRRRRMRLAEEDPYCPMHTEAGRIMGFFQYLFPAEEAENFDIASEKSDDSAQGGQ